MLSRARVAATIVCLLTSCSSSLGSRPTTPSTAEPTPPSSNPSTAATDIVAVLRARPLRLPSIASGEPCPVTTVVSRPSADLAPMLGDGPARPVGLAPPGALEMSPPANFGSSTWGGQKVLWALDAHAQQPVLVRGRQLDGDGDVRFNAGDIPAAELVLDAATDAQPLDGGWYGFAGYTRVELEGCYGYQIDNEDSTTIVVFTAKNA